MTPSTDLHRLIRSMTKAEKRQFTLSIKRTTSADGTIMLRVFEAIARQPTYDESALLAQFSGEPFTTAFAAYKHHLMQVVLRSLAQGHESGSRQAQLVAMVQHVDILYDRGLYDLSYKAIVRVRKRVDEAEDFELSMRLLQQERRLVVSRRTTHETGEDMRAAIRRIDDATAQLLAVMAELVAVRRVQSELFDAHLHFADYFASFEEGLAWADTRMSDPVMADVDVLASFAARSLWYHAHVTYEAQFTRRYARAFSFARRLVEHMEKEPERIRLDGLSYMRVLATAATTAIWAFDAEAAMDMVNRSRTAPERYGFSRSEVIHRFDLQAYLQHACALTIAMDLSDIDTLVDGVDDVIDRHAHLGRMSEISVLMMAAAELLLHAGRYGDAITWYERVLRIPDLAVDTSVTVRTGLCLAHVLDGRTDVVVSLATSALRSARKLRLKLDPADAFLRMIRRYVVAKLDQRTKLLEDFIATCDQSAETMPPLAREAYLQSIGILWARSIITGPSMIEQHRVLTEQARRRLDD